MVYRIFTLWLAASSLPLPTEWPSELSEFDEFRKNMPTAGTDGVAVRVQPVTAGVVTSGVRLYSCTRTDGVAARSGE